MDKDTQTRAIKVGIGLLIIGVIVGLVAWKLSDYDRKMTPLMQQLATEVEQRFSEKLPRQRDINRILLLVVERGSARPEEDQFRDQLINRIEASDKYALVTWSKAESVLKGDELNKWRVKFGFADPSAKPATLDQAVDVMKRLDRYNFAIDGILFIEITQFYEGDSQDGFGAKVGVKGTIWSRLKDKQVAEVGPVQEGITSRTDMRYLSHAMSNQSVLWRFPVWMLVSCGLPWLLIGVVRMVVKKRSNGANMALLLLFTVVDVGLAWVLIMAFGSGGLTIFGLVIIAALMGYYNYDALDYIERRLL